MKYKLKVWQRSSSLPFNASEWCWHIKHANGRIVCHGESYLRRGDMLTMLSQLFRGTAIADQVEQLRQAK